MVKYPILKYIVIYSILIEPTNFFNYFFSLFLNLDLAETRLNPNVEWKNYFHSFITAIIQVVIIRSTKISFSLGVQMLFDSFYKMKVENKKASLKQCKTVELY